MDAIPKETPLNIGLFNRSRISASFNYHGLSQNIAKRFNLSSKLSCNAFWLHGVNYKVENLVNHIGGVKKSTAIQVASDSDARFLAELGYSNFILSAYGFVYTPEQITGPRIFEDSLLAIPSSDISSKTLECEELQYLDFLQALKGKYDAIYVLVPIPVYGLSLSDIPVTRELLKRGLIPLRGGMYLDSNSFGRVRYYLEHFRTVTMNSLGSLFAYSLFCGCRFLFDGPWRNVYEDRTGMFELRFIEGACKLMSKSDAQSMYEKISIIGSLQEVRTRFGNFFSVATEDKKLGEQLLGFQHCLSQQQLCVMTNQRK